MKLLDNFSYLVTFFIKTIKMPKCTKLDFNEMGFNSIYNVKCQHCGYLIEFFTDEKK